MRVQYENKTFYILLKCYDTSVHGGILAELNCKVEYHSKVRGRITYE